MWLVYTVLGIILLVLLYMIFRKKSESSSPPRREQDLSKLRITDATVGDAISVAGAGDDFDDLEFTVDRRNRYESGGEKWFEISGVYKGRRIFVEYHEDDQLEVNATLDPGKLTLQDLGISEEDLGRMDEEQRRSNTIDYDDEKWSYTVSHEVGYFRDGRGDGEGYYSWEFDSEDGKRLLSVEKWEGEPFEGHVARRIHPDDIQVFRA